MTRRRTPEELLKQAQAEDARGSRGRLKIFLGYASGSGKSSRMFDEGCRRAARGQDLVVAAVQPSGAPVTSLETIPQLAGGAINVGSVLARHPRVCLVDALAWNNPPGSVNPYRWQDVRDIMAADINVIASINIQYVSELPRASYESPVSTSTRPYPKHSSTAPTKSSSSIPRPSRYILRNCAKLRSFWQRILSISSSKAICVITVSGDRPAYRSASSSA